MSPKEMDSAPFGLGQIGEVLEGVLESIEGVDPILGIVAFKDAMERSAARLLNV
jgi:hypothetical protein